MNRISDAFRRLRKRGLIARQNFSCCGNCAGYEIATYITHAINHGMSRQAVAGCVFYTRQDTVALRRGRGHMYLSYGPLETKDLGTVGLPTIEVGQIICTVLRESGIKYEWDGNPDTRIAIDVADAQAEALPAPPPVARLPRRTSARQRASQDERQALAERAAQRLLTEVGHGR